MLHDRTQGYPLHFDNVNVFFIQVSGRKHWKVYKPVVQDPMYNVPRDSHGEYEDNQDVRKDILLDVTLEAGQVLYIPRGFLHEGWVEASETEPSVHLTVSPEVCDCQ